MQKYNFPTKEKLIFIKNFVILKFNAVKIKYSLSEDHKRSNSRKNEEDINVISYYLLIIISEIRITSIYPLSFIDNRSA